MTMIHHHTSLPSETAELGPPAGPRHPAVAPGHQGQSARPPRPGDGRSPPKEPPARSGSGRLTPVSKAGYWLGVELLIAWLGEQLRDVDSLRGGSVSVHLSVCMVRNGCIALIFV